LPNAVIEISRLNFAYHHRPGQRGQPVLGEVDLSILKGDCVALLGPNGGGKTTLIKLCLGLLRPDSGSIKILGQEVGQGLKQVIGRIGYVPQDLSLNPGFPITVLDLVLTGRLAPGRGRFRFNKEDRAAARQALEEVGLWERRGWRMDRLSGGQRQRVMLARALVTQPELLFLDEPTASVDKEWQTRLYDLFKELNKKATLVVVSHDLSVISSYVKSVACVNQSLHYHPRPEITADMLSQTYRCPVELVAHGLPHRVLGEHDHGGGEHD
jgi:zinc transport system ATP-binding protein